MCIQFLMHLHVPCALFLCRTFHKKDFWGILSYLTPPTFHKQIYTNYLIIIPFDWNPMQLAEPACNRGISYTQNSTYDEMEQNRLNYIRAIFRLLKKTSSGVMYHG